MADWWYIEPQKSWEHDYSARRDFRRYLAFLHALIYSVCGLPSLSHLMDALATIKADVSRNGSGPDTDLVIYAAFRAAGSGNVETAALPHSTDTIDTMHTLLARGVFESMVLVTLSYSILDKHAKRLDVVMRDCI